MLDEKFVESMPKLGFGLMRLPRADVEKDIIDIDHTEKMANLFLGSGLKYLDSAYVYNGSEEAARKAITSKHPRASYYITSKLNVNVAKTIEEAKNQINISLEREGVDYLDFYLLHAINDTSIEKYEEWNLFEYVKELKEMGKMYN